MGARHCFSMSSEHIRIPRTIRLKKLRGSWLARASVAVLPHFHFLLKLFFPIYVKERYKRSMDLPVVGLSFWDGKNLFVFSLTMRNYWNARIVSNGKYFFL